MLIHGVNDLSNVRSPQLRTPATPAKPVQTSPVLDVVDIGNHAASVAPTYRPIQTPATPATPIPATGFAALFSNYVPTATAPVIPVSAAPVPFVATFEQGAYVSSPDGSKTSLNPLELASQSTAQQVAALLGGTVVDSPFGGSFATSVPIRQISVPGSNVQINAGLAANLFATYGTAQGSQAWLQINRDLGRDPQSTAPVS